MVYLVSSSGVHKRPIRPYQCITSIKSPNMIVKKIRTVRWVVGNDIYPLLHVCVYTYTSTYTRSSITRKCHRRCHMYYYWRPSVSTGGTCIKYGSGVCGAWLTSPQCDSHHVYIREHHKRSPITIKPHFLVSNLTQVCKAFFSHLSSKKFSVLKKEATTR